MTLTEQLLRMGCNVALNLAGLLVLGVSSDTGLLRVCIGLLLINLAVRVVVPGSAKP